MNVVWNQVSRLTVVLVMLLGLTVVGPMVASAQNGGNSTAAQACQQGGYAELVGVQNGELTSFTNTGQCASYAAHGGQLVPTGVVLPCQDGGYAGLARTEDNTTAFASQAECVSYAIAGGMVVPLYVAPVPTISIVYLGTSDVYGNQAGTEITRCLYSVTYYNLPMPDGEYTYENRLIDVTFYHNGALESVSGRFKENGVPTNDIVPFGVTQVIVVTDRYTGEVLATGEPQVCEAAA